MNFVHLGGVPKGPDLQANLRKLSGEPGGEHHQADASDSNGRRRGPTSRHHFHVFSQGRRGCRLDPSRIPNAAPEADAQLDLDALRVARSRRKISDALLRRVSRLPAGAWRQLMAGAPQPDVATLLRLADAVGVAVDDLLTRPDQ